MQKTVLSETVKVNEDKEHSSLHSEVVPDLIGLLPHTLGMTLNVVGRAVDDVDPFSMVVGALEVPFRVDKTSVVFLTGLVSQRAGCGVPPGPEPSGELSFSCQVEFVVQVPLLGRRDVFDLVGDARGLLLRETGHRGWPYPESFLRNRAPAVSVIHDRQAQDISPRRKGRDVDPSHIDARSAGFPPGLGGEALIAFTIGIENGIPGGIGPSCRQTVDLAVHIEHRNLRAVCTQGIGDHLPAVLDEFTPG